MPTVSDPSPELTAIREIKEELSELVEIVDNLAVAMQTQVKIDTLKLQHQCGILKPAEIAVELKQMRADELV